jgi:predicted ABC-type ATPase
MRAGRLLLTRIRELAEARQDFAFETTLAGRSYVKLIAEFRRSGYDVIFFFLWLPSAEAAVARVATRVRQGGHDVPEETIRRRFRTGIRNFFTIYSSLVNSWHLYDGSILPPRLIASRINGALVAHQPRLYNETETQWEN